MYGEYPYSWPSDFLRPYKIVISNQLSQGDDVPVSAFIISWKLICIMFCNTALSCIFVCSSLWPTAQLYIIKICRHIMLWGYIESFVSVCCCISVCLCMFVYTSLWNLISICHTNYRCTLTCSTSDVSLSSDGQ